MSSFAESELTPSGPEPVLGPAKGRTRGGYLPLQGRKAVRPALSLPFEGRVPSQARRVGWSELNHASGKTGEPFP